MLMAFQIYANQFDNLGSCFSHYLQGIIYIYICTSESKRKN